MDHCYSNKNSPPTTTLQALCRQEETHYRTTGAYLQHQHRHHLSSSSTTTTHQNKRQKCRAAMANWCCTVVDYLEFERDTVAIAMNCLDRFLETPMAQELQCLSQPRQFKIAGMTCLYTAIKAHEPEAIEPDLVVELSGNLCDPEDVEDMERVILHALTWHMNPPTALSFVRQLLDTCPKCVLKQTTKETLLELAQVQTELAIHEDRFVATPPSLLALACIFNALESSQSKKDQPSLELLDDLSQLFFVALGSSQNLNMDRVFEMQDILDDIIRRHNQKQQMGDESSLSTSSAARRQRQKEEQQEEEQQYCAEQEQHHEEEDEEASCVSEDDNNSNGSSSQSSDTPTQSPASTSNSDNSKRQQPDDPAYQDDDDNNNNKANNTYVVEVSPTTIVVHSNHNKDNSNSNNIMSSSSHHHHRHHNTSSPLSRCDAAEAA